MVILLFCCKFLISSYQIHGLEIFSPIDFFFTLLIVSFCCVEPYYFDVVSLVCFCFYCLCFGVISKKWLSRSIKELFPCIFFWKFYSFRSCMQVFNPFQVNFHEWCKIEAQFHYVACGYSFPNTIYSETTLSPLCVIGHLVKDFAIVVVQLLSHVRLFVTLWTAAHQSFLSFTISWSLLKLVSIESVTQLPLLCYPFSPALSLSHHHGLFNESALPKVLELQLQRLIDHICMILFLGSLFCSIGLCVSFCTRTIIFWLLWLCNIVWRQDVWCLQLCSSFSRSLWLFEVFCDSIQIF